MAPPAKSRGGATVCGVAGARWHAGAIVSRRVCMAYVCMALAAVTIDVLVELRWGFYALGCVQGASLAVVGWYLLDPERASSAKGPDRG